MNHGEGWRGRRLGEMLGDARRYEIQHELGSGAMGRVFAAVDHKLQSRVVVKVLADTFASNPGVRERFMNEALIQANLLHTNIVRALDTVQDGALLAIIMDFVDGTDLEGHLAASGGRLPLGEILALMTPVADAVHTAHERGIVHRDLKPANILLERRPDRMVPKVADFGIAKILSTTGDGKTRAGAVMGTPSYMPPEQLRGELNLDGRADVYALGAILYQLATGNLPFAGNSEYEVTHQVLSGHLPVPPSGVNPTLPPAFDAVVGRAMASDPSQRYPSAMHLKVDLENLANGRPVTAGLPPAPGPMGGGGAPHGQGVPAPSPPQHGGRAQRQEPAPETVFEAPPPQPAHEPAPQPPTPAAPARSQAPLLIGAAIFSLCVIVLIVGSLSADVAPPEEQTVTADGPETVVPQPPVREEDTPVAGGSESTPTPPELPVEVAEPKWYCLCYGEFVRGVRTSCTACRASWGECSGLADAVRSGRKPFIPGSLSRGCTEKEGSHPAEIMGNYDLWKPSSKPGAWWSTAGCLL